MGDIGVRPDEKVRQWTGFFASCSPVFLKRFARLKSGVEREWQICECGETVFQFLLCIKLDGQFGKNNDIISDGALAASARFDRSTTRTNQDPW